MLGARVLAAHGALLDLVRCEQCHRLLDTAGPVPPADEAPRRIGAAQMPRAVDLPIDHAYGLMRRADRLAAARALRHFVRAHRLVGAALAILAARRTETPASLRRIRAALLGVPVAHDPAAAAARREARRAGGVPVLGADPFVGRALLQAARRTDAHVLVARRLLVHATLRDTMVAAEVLGTDRAARRARLAAAVVVPADHQRRGRTTAIRTREHPSRPTTEGPLGAERRAAPVRGLELPLGALHQDSRVDQLQRMHDGLDLAAPDLLGAATLGQRRHRANGLGVRLLLEDRLEVPVQATELGSQGLLRGRASRRDPLRRLFLEMVQEEPQQIPRLPGRDR